jgi:hypothetical protein
MPQRDAIVNRAARYVGYLSGGGFDQKNKFSDFLGHPAEAWCGDFVTAIYAMAGLTLPSMQPGVRTGFTYVPDGWAYGVTNHASRNSWEAQPGDIVCFDWTGAGTCKSSKSHTGLVDHWSAGVLYTIEGNSGPAGGVNRHPRSAPSGAGNPDICGVINTAKLVTFDGSPAPPEPHDDVPQFPGRVLMLKSPPMSGDDVRRWQTQMQHRGWHLDAGGQYDAHTRDICIQFQHQRGFAQTGSVGAQTWTAAWTAPITPD